MARLRTTPSSQVRTLPRARSYRAPLRQAERKASCETSSAAAAVADDPVGERVGGTAVAVVEDLEGVGLLALDERHQVLVGEALKVSTFTSLPRMTFPTSSATWRISLAAN